jgi:uncharacterized membrane protein
MATFDSIFPTFLARCSDLHTLLLSVAYALLVTGIIVNRYRLRRLELRPCNGARQWN